MSKCQAKKYLAGGRCSGSSSFQKEDTQGVQTSFSQLLAQREAMDAKMWAAPSKEIVSKETTLIVHQQIVPKSQQKKSDIDCILGNDFE
jgi:hypothetical protein